MFIAAFAGKDLSPVRAARLYLQLLKRYQKVPKLIPMVRFPNCTGTECINNYRIYYNNLARILENMI